jgi:hypothetical protein
MISWLRVAAAYSPVKRSPSTSSTGVRRASSAPRSRKRRRYRGVASSGGVEAGDGDAPAGSRDVRFW